MPFPPCSGDCQRKGISDASRARFPFISSGSVATISAVVDTRLNKADTLDVNLHGLLNSQRVGATPQGCDDLV